MRGLKFLKAGGRRAQVAAFTLAEVVMCILIAAIVFAGIIGSYVQAAYRAEWSGFSLAAQALAIQQLEQAKAAVWDGSQCNLTNLLTLTSAPLDLPIPGSMTNAVYATNYATVTSIDNPDSAQVSVYMVRVDTVWPFRWKTKVTYFTNSVACYYSMDNPAL